MKNAYSCTGIKQRKPARNCDISFYSVSCTSELCKQHTVYSLFGLLSVLESLFKVLWTFRAMKLFFLWKTETLRCLLLKMYGGCHLLTRLLVWASIYYYKYILEKSVIWWFYFSCLPTNLYNVKQKNYNTMENSL